LPLFSLRRCLAEGGRKRNVGNRSQHSGAGLRTAAKVADADADMAIPAKPTPEASNQTADADKDEDEEEGRNQLLKGRTNMRQIREADNQVEHLRGNTANFNRRHLQARHGHPQVQHVRQRQAETEAGPREENKEEEEAR
jgi:hypothetical protein